jgi:hypothetical protein
VERIAETAIEELSRFKDLLEIEVHTQADMVRLSEANTLYLTIVGRLIVLAEMESMFRNEPIN